MSRNMKVWFITAVALVFCGMIIFCAQMTVYGWDFSKLGNENYDTDTHVIESDFSDISVDTTTADLSILPSQDGKVRVVCFEEKAAPHNVTVVNEALKITQVNEKSWYDYLDFNFRKPKITIYLPEAEYGSLLVRVSTGDINVPAGFKFEGVEASLTTGDVNIGSSVSGALKIDANTGRIALHNISVGSLFAKVTTGTVRLSEITGATDVNINQTTGDAWLSGVSCRSFCSVGSSGDIEMRSVIASDKLTVNRTTGDVEFYDCD
ncbi:MAG: DUF4097 family beta strand repeat protein, partial [Clostridia bacterium]|nr:DUF4097 family beta strand repeat protein [Clostridia bacterium]